MFLVTNYGLLRKFKVSVCGNFKFPNIASAEGFELFSCPGKITLGLIAADQLINSRLASFPAIVLINEEE